MKYPYSVRDENKYFGFKMCARRVAEMDSTAHGKRVRCQAIGLCRSGQGAILIVQPSLCIVTL